MVRIVWLVDPQKLWETDWIRYLLKNVEIEEEIYEKDREKVYENAVVVINHEDHPVRTYEEYFALYEDAAVPYGVFHLSDETLSASCAFYDAPMCKFVLRNYVHPKYIQHPKTHFIGLGYKTGFAAAPHQHEPTPWYHWNFVGSIHTHTQSERAKHLLLFKDIRPHFLLQTEEFSKGGMDVGNFRRVLELSKFTPCFMGQCNLDTFRFYEAMEAGSVPIVLSTTPQQDYRPTYWTYMFPWYQGKAFPFLMVQHWEEAVEKINQYLDHPKEYMELRRALLEFWEDAKDVWVRQATDLVADLVRTTAPLENA